MGNNVTLVVAAVVDMNIADNAVEGRIPREP